MNIPDKWTPIAFERGGRWHPEPGALLTVVEARALYHDGLILMAQRRAPLEINKPIPPMQLVIKRKG